MVCGLSCSGHWLERARPACLEGKGFWGVFSYNSPGLVFPSSNCASDTILANYPLTNEISELRSPASSLAISALWDTARFHEAKIHNPNETRMAHPCERCIQSPLKSADPAGHKQHSLTLFHGYEFAMPSDRQASGANYPESEGSSTLVSETLRET